MKKALNDTELKLLSTYRFFKSGSFQTDGKNKSLHLTGPIGSGKTSALLNTFEMGKRFYFSFKGLCTQTAKPLFIAELQKLNSEIKANSWQEAFDAINTLTLKMRIFIFDDVECMMQEKEFVCALQNFIDDTNRRQVFLILVSNDGIELNELDTCYHTIRNTYLPISAIKMMQTAKSNAYVNLQVHPTSTTKNTYPKRTGDEIVEMFTLSGGIPCIADAFKIDMSIDDNILSFLTGKSHFTSYAWDVLAYYFRRPHTYAFILHALALGHSRISEIGKFTGFAYNKCDKYIKALIKIKLVKAEEVATSSTQNKTVYSICNSYFKIYFQHIYPNRTLIEQGLFKDECFNKMMFEVREVDVPKTYIDACFTTLGHRMTYDISMKIRFQHCYNPVTINTQNGPYTFDYMAKEDGKAVFVKIFHDGNATIGKAEFDKLYAASTSIQPYFDCIIYLFAKRRFSDYLVHEASFKIVKLFNLDRMKFVVRYDELGK